MLEIVRTVLPEPEQWLGLGATLLAALAFSGLGRIGRRGAGPPGLSVLLGWTVVSFVLTIVGVFTPWSFGPAFWATMALAGAALVWSLRRFGIDAPTKDLLRVFALGLPLLVIVAAKAPSEVDSFTHWLPNGAYLFDHGGFLRAGRPPSPSEYPGFPYNVTFLFYVVGRLAGIFVENAVILFNVVLLLLFAGLLVWLIRKKTAGNEPQGGWGISALSLILATLLNPVFVRRIWLTSYPDTATAVVVAFAGICAWRWMESLSANGREERGRAVAFGLVLALLINIKQANPVLVAGLVAGPALIAWRDPEISLGRFWRRLGLVLGPAVLLYAAWNYYLLAVAPLRENEIRPPADWPLDRLPDLLGQMAIVVTHKGYYFVLAIGLTTWACRAWLRRPRTAFDRLALIVGAVFVVYNLFLVFIYVAHFGGYPQSYWRYNTHIGFLVLAAAVDAAALAYGRWRPSGLRASSRLVRYAAAGIIVAVPVCETALAGYWRFDLELPKPLLRDAGRDLARTLPRNAAVVVIVPGDNGNFSSILRHYAMRVRPDVHVTPAARPAGVIAAARQADPATPFFVWSYCAQPWMERDFGVSPAPGRAVMIGRDGDGWKIVRTWPHPAPGGLRSYSKNFDRSSCGKD